YRYILPGYTTEGKEKELDIKGQLTRPLRKGAYLKITWNKNIGVTSYEEVEKKDVP
ncbi:YxeA family protein, partial [Enterococcus faecium]|uniref:YxeA family protein n=1 Tax=Enterococcus faecium TaxID=1352 RepID=UPI003CC62411